GSEMSVVEYEVVSKNLTSKMSHELLFSVKKRWFVKPFRHDRQLGKLHYKLLPGNYIKFGLYVLKNQDYARFEIAWVHVDKDGKIEARTVYSIETYWHIFIDIENDLNCPYVLAKFIEMRPEFHKTAWVEESNYSIAEDDIQMVESIKRYLERKIASD
uniref:Putative uncharacterized protein n=1 Tax=Acidianus filamentous virus 1 TaxID=235266 RepID=UPI0001CC4705|nr:Chain A, Crystal structure of ORF157-E86A of Acidianus filamentous virus 1 [Captovirus AFV1]